MITMNNLVEDKNISFRTLNLKKNNSYNII